MTSITQGGVVMFGPQADMGVAVDDTAYNNSDWRPIRVDDIDLGILDDQRMFPMEIGGEPVPTGAYKNGIAVAGGVTCNPRMKSDLGWMLYAALGGASKTAGSKTGFPAVAFERLLAKTALKDDALEISTGFGTLPTAGAKVSVRLYKGDNVTYRPTITVTGTDGSGAKTETFDFYTGPGTGQRSVGFDPDPSSGIGYECLVGSTVFKTVTGIEAVAHGTETIGSETVQVSVGHEDAGAYTHRFIMDPTDPTFVPWVGFRKYIPPAKKGGDAVAETYKDCKLLSLGMVLPNEGLIQVRMDAEGRDFELVRNPWAANEAGRAAAPWKRMLSDVTYEDYDSVPIASVKGNYIKIPAYSDDKLPVVNASIGWANQPLDPRMEKIFGSYYLDDVTITGRQMVFNVTVKWTSPELYQAILTGSKIGTEWSSTPFTTRLDILAQAPGLIPSSLVPYSVRVQAQKVLMNMRGAIRLAGQNAVMATFTGSAMKNPGNEYAAFELTNAQDDYAWPSAS